MASFTPILGTEQLSPIGAAREVLALDFKADRYDPARPFEMAKDVASFANASGGTILVGASEDKERHVLVAYKPMPDEATAAAQSNAVSEAVRDRCMPPPLINPVVLNHPDGGFVVAINVWPFPAQAVGVKVHADKASEGWGGDAYVFPLRVGVHTQFLRPEQLPMLMLPKLRTSAILLDAIAPGEPVFVIDERGMQRGGNHGIFTSVNALACTFTVTYTGQPVEIPLDVVRSVWCADGFRQIAIEGRWGPNGQYHRTSQIPGHF